MSTPTSYIEISKKNLVHNFDIFKKIVGEKSKIYSVVKSNAYGHGMIEIASILAQEKCVDGLIVTSIQEGVTLRKKGISLPIVCVGFIPKEDMEEVVKNEIIPVVYRVDVLEKLIGISKVLKKKTKIYLKVETGTFRQGVLEEDLDKFLERIKQSEYLKLEGVSMHFANIEDTTDHSFAEGQLEKFNEIADLVRKKGFTKIKLSSAASAAALLFSKTHFDLVRIGISGYGLWPSNETLLSFRHIFNGKIPELEPVLSWKSKIAQIKAVPTGSKISYGCTFETTRDSKVAILPVGYYEGYSRALSNKSHVLICGKKAKVLGRVCMNMIIVDVTDIPGAREYDEAVLIGISGNEKITADYLAKLSSTINYEITTRINKDLPRLIK